MAKLAIIWASLFGLSMTAFGVSDFTVEWILPKNDAAESLIRIVPPEKHHLNLKAPFSVENERIQFLPVLTDSMALVFRAKKEAPRLGDEANVMAYLCDDAGTYCVKKKVVFKFVTENKTVSERLYQDLSLKISKGDLKVDKSVSKSSLQKSDSFGFIDNDSKLAFDKAATLKKLVFIDFYGIWCPPCNLFDETVFSKPAFRKFSDAFVFLKMDADRESSWALKSKFKVGGYPTLIIADSGQREIDRIVGYLPIDALIERMMKAKSSEPKTLEEQTKEMKGKPGYLELLRRLIYVQLQRKEYDQALESAEEGLKAEGANFYYRVIQLQEKARKLSDSNDSYKKMFESDSVRSLFKNLNEKATDVDSDTLIAAQDLVMAASDKADMKNELKFVDHWISMLKSRVNRKTLYLDQSEYSIADIDSLRVEWLEKTVADKKDSKALHDAYQSAISSYESMLAHYKNKDSRALNLELAYYLKKAGRIEEAKKVYSKFIKKYPKEFTFWFAESKLYSELKEFEHAIQSAKNALQYSYGDNFIRSVENLAKIQFESGATAEALKTIDANFSKMKAPSSDTFVRTQKYIDQLKKLREKIVLGAQSKARS